MKSSRKRIILILLSVIVFLILLTAGFRLYFVLRENGRIYSSEKLLEKMEEESKEAGDNGEEARGEIEGREKAFDAIVVLGCGVYADGSLSPLLQYRMEKTLELYKAGAADKIYITGDHREGEYDEVDHMAEWLYAKGVSDKALILDYDGYSTYESLLHVSEGSGITPEEAAEQLKQISRKTEESREGSAEDSGKDDTEIGPETGRFPLNKVIIVTQKYHLYRALYVGEKLGIDVTGVYAQDWPMSAGTLMRHLREIPACFKDWLQTLGIEIRV
ncbi:MAG: YdcF family protein [Lachnospiraceae bacterium]|nr:YdcF family protein [Lachnospiraceae bacterium]